MTKLNIRSTVTSEADSVLDLITDYVCSNPKFSDLAYETAHYCLLDSIACGLQALDYPACTKVLGPIVPGATLSGGARIPGTSLELEPVMAAFNIGTMIRWLDFNDTWLAAEWGHPSDNLGGIFAVADYLSRSARIQGNKPLLVHDVVTTMIKAHEIQGILSIDNSFNRVGLDHVLLVRIATTAVITKMMGGTREQVINAISNAWVDGGALRNYRHEPNTGSRKSWAAGDATSRGVRLALMAMTGEMGYPLVLSAKNWGFYDVLYRSKTFKVEQKFGCYVMENILFKISYPAEFHAQTAIEASLLLHEEIKDRLDDITRIIIETQEPGIRIIDKSGPLLNPADRDHCLQYMVAIPLLYGRLTASDYEDDIADDPMIDVLRKKMEVRENTNFTNDYFDKNKRYIGNAVQVFFKDKTFTKKVQVDVPIGHRKRRAEGAHLLKSKFQISIEKRLKDKQIDQLLLLYDNPKEFLKMAFDDFIALLVV